MTNQCFLSNPTPTGHGKRTRQSIKNGSCTIVMGSGYSSPLSTIFVNFLGAYTYQEKKLKNKTRSCLKKLSSNEEQQSKVKSHYQIISPSDSSSKTFSMEMKKMYLTNAWPSLSLPCFIHMDRQHLLP